MRPLRQGREVAYNHLSSLTSANVEPCGSQLDVEPRVRSLVQRKGSEALQIISRRFEVEELHVVARGVERYNAIMY